MVSIRRGRDEAAEPPTNSLGEPYAPGTEPGTTSASRPGPSALDDPAYERFGGVNIGAAFFGWMVAVGTTVLLSALVGVVVLVLGLNTDVEQVRTQVDLGTGSIVSAVVVLVVLLVSYYSGGYVAGRMSRFDGGRQGFAVWLFALVLTVVAGVGGYFAGDRYDVVARNDLPSLGVDTGDATLAGLVSLAVVLLGTLLAATAGGKVGRRYHAKVDRAL